MAETRTCPECGAALRDDAPDAPCPACLMRLGLESWVGRTAAVAATVDSPGSAAPGRFQPPQPSELDRLFPQFEILELLGHGGMGAVYKVRQRSLDRQVALKIIKPDAANEPGFAERFAREAKALARLNHQNIVSVFDFGETGSLPTAGQQDRGEKLYYFVMEYVDGTNLRRLMEDGDIGSEQALSIIPQVCEALQFAHDEGIVHRDIKPENILIDSRGRVKIADFGLVKLLGESTGYQTLTGSHQIMGTPHYMAPEQLERSRAVDHRADIYSLGVVFYEMLTGELPLGKFDMPSVKAHVDARLDEIVLRTLEKEVARRYQRASEVKTDVESLSSVAAQQPPHRQPHLQAPSSKAQPAKQPLDDPQAGEVARRQVQGPAIGLILVGILDLLPLLLVFLSLPAYIIFPVRDVQEPEIERIDLYPGLASVAPAVGVVGHLVMAQAQSMPPVADARVTWTWLALAAGFLLLASVPFSLLLILAGIKMRKLELYGLAVIASILALLPCHLGWFAGLAIGIWSLMVLSRPAIKQAFAQQALAPMT